MQEISKSFLDNDLDVFCEFTEENRPLNDYKHFLDNVISCSLLYKLLNQLLSVTHAASNPHQVISVGSNCGERDLLHAFFQGHKNLFQQVLNI